MTGSPLAASACRSRKSAYSQTSKLLPRPFYPGPFTLALLIGMVPADRVINADDGQYQDGRNLQTLPDHSRVLSRAAAPASV